MKPEHLALVLVFISLSVVLLWRFFHWIEETPATPDPWAKDFDDAVNQPDAVPICPRCLSPQEQDGRFCEACGSSIGFYNNLNPYLYIFSLGEVLRLGTGGSIQKNPVTVLGYLLLSVAEFTVFAPVYWYLFYRNLKRLQHDSVTSHTVPSVPA